MEEDTEDTDMIRFCTVLYIQRPRMEAFFMQFPGYMPGKFSINSLTMGKEIKNIFEN